VEIRRHLPACAISVSISVLIAGSRVVSLSNENNRPMPKRDTAQFSSADRSREYTRLRASLMLNQALDTIEKRKCRSARTRSPRKENLRVTKTRAIIGRRTISHKDGSNLKREELQRSRCGEEAPRLKADMPFSDDRSRGYRVRHQKKAGSIPRMERICIQ